MSFQISVSERHGLRGMGRETECDDMKVLALWM